MDFFNDFERPWGLWDVLGGLGVKSIDFYNDFERLRGAVRGCKSRVPSGIYLRAPEHEAAEALPKRASNLIEHQLA